MDFWCEKSWNLTNAVRIQPRSQRHWIHHVRIFATKHLQAASHCLHLTLLRCTKRLELHQLTWPNPERRKIWRRTLKKIYANGDSVCVCWDVQCKFVAFVSRLQVRNAFPPLLILINTTITLRETLAFNALMDTTYSKWQSRDAPEGKSTRSNVSLGAPQALTTTTTTTTTTTLAQHVGGITNIKWN